MYETHMKSLFTNASFCNHVMLFAICCLSITSDICKGNIKHINIINVLSDAGGRCCSTMAAVIRPRLYLKKSTHTRARVHTHIIRASYSTEQKDHEREKFKWGGEGGKIYKN